ncbi:prepilin-type N-terminal cleavage/methylation domain-containing protein [Psychrobacter sp. ANT_H56B]|uniref:type IV pilin protein n=1 Tax=Psychrobacter sp. ANT_H56B TaxID=2597353 RepID=UPI0011F129CD|nr:prepilin-type N-terminal cleavage/methylation domain-containing protein [Psychrobacter sp. ANT_H56B]KAA0927486.1 prepilin-type N-terminal cleavage/methylation domain-containing protein [Psychrobacter sp. ANT_H56B]
MNTSTNRQLSGISETQRGFTLIEMMIVVAIIGILAAISYPSYQQYVIKSKRTDMMSEMQNIASIIESRKLAQGSYSNALRTGLTGNYPKQGTALYNVTVETIVAPVSPPPDPPPPLDPLTSKWIITATPITGTQMANDGTMTINYVGIKCRVIKTINTCGTDGEWNK